MRTEDSQITATHKIKDKGVYKLDHIRPDGTQVFKAANDNRTADKVILLKGPERTEASIGARGHIHYFYGRNFGRHAFIQIAKEIL